MAGSLRNFTSAEDSITNDNNTYSKRESGGVAVYDIQQSGAYGATKMVDTYVPIEASDNSNMLILGGADTNTSRHEAQPGKGWLTPMPAMNADNTGHWSGFRTATLPSQVPSNAYAVEVEVKFDANTTGNRAMFGWMYAPSKRATYFSDIDSVTYNGTETVAGTYTSSQNTDIFTGHAEVTSRNRELMILWTDPIPEAGGDNGASHEAMDYKRTTIMLDSGSRDLEWFLMKTYGIGGHNYTLEVRVVGYYVKQAVGSMDGSSMGGISTRIHNIYKKTTSMGNGGFGTIASPVPAGEWLVSVDWIENQDGTDEDTAHKLSKKYSIPTGYWLHFGLVGSTALYAITTSSNPPTQSEMTDLSTLGLPDSEFSTLALTDQLLVIKGFAIEVQGVAGGGGGANVTIGPDAPAGASEGDLWFDDADGSLYVYDGGLAAWVQTNTGGGGGGANVTVGTDAPADATEGDLWYDDGTGSLYVYDGGLAAWVQTNGGGGSGGGNWSTGWVNTDGTTAVANGATLNFTHNLGTSDIIVSAYYADDANGSNAKLLHDAIYTGGIDGGGASSPAEGYDITAVTNSTITVQLGSNGIWGNLTSTGTASTSEANAISYAGKYIKVVASAGGGSSGTTGEIPRTQWPVRAVDGLNSPNMIGNLTLTEFQWKYSPQSRCNLGRSNSWVFSCARGLNGSSAHAVAFSRDKDLVRAYHGDSNTGHGCSVVTLSNTGSYNRGGYVVNQTGESGWQNVSSSASPNYGIDANIMAYVTPTVVSNVIHNGATSNTWTNMSTGINNSLVMLLVEPNAGAPTANTWIKRGSDTDNYKTSTASWTGHGCAAGIIDGSNDAGGTPHYRGHYAFCMTDSSGNLSIATSVTSSATITLIGYVPSATTSDSTLLNNQLVANAPEAVSGTGSGEDAAYGTDISTGLTGYNLVLLKTIGTSGTGNNIYFRTPGDSVTMYRASTWMGQGCAAGYINNTGATYQLAMTDVSGKLKAFSSNQSNCTIKMIGSTAVQLA